MPSGHDHTHLIIRSGKGCTDLVSLVQTELDCFGCCCSDNVHSAPTASYTKGTKFQTHKSCTQAITSTNFITGSSFPKLKWKINFACQNSKSAHCRSSSRILGKNRGIVFCFGGFLGTSGWLLGETGCWIRWPFNRIQRLKVIFAVIIWNGTSISRSNLPHSTRWSRY